MNSGTKSGSRSGVIICNIKKSGTKSASEVGLYFPKKNMLVLKGDPKWGYSKLLQLCCSPVAALLQPCCSSVAALLRSGVIVSCCSSVADSITPSSEPGNHTDRKMQRFTLAYLTC